MSFEYPGGWFGRSWRAPVNETAQHLPTPVGERCLKCDNIFAEDDQGMTFPGVDADGVAGVRSMHLGCFLVEIGVDPDAS